MSGGRLWALNYAQVCVMQTDTIEKKPLYHFLPGARALSVGTFGCNLSCSFCQNHQLAMPMGRVPADTIPPESLVNLARAKQAEVIAFTFNEPTVWAEYVVDAAALASKAGIRTMANSNGYMSGQARHDILRAVDAVKIDIKAFTEDGYRRLCGGHLQPVLDTCREAANLRKHVEVAYPLVRGENDSQLEIEALGRFLADEMGKDIPLHLFRFRPFFRMADAPGTELPDMEAARETLLRCGIRYVYFGGAVGGEHQGTTCPGCGEPLIIRKAKEEGEKVFVRQQQMSRFCPSFGETVNKLNGCRCPNCGLGVYGQWSR
jgi:pyruvate formate lyase activating enzyme